MGALARAHPLAAVAPVNFHNRPLACSGSAAEVSLG
jgi:hypothetical protein